MYLKKKKKHKTQNTKQNQGATALWSKPSSIPIINDDHP